MASKSPKVLRAWYLETFADGQHLEGKELRNHLTSTIARLHEVGVEG